MDVHRETIRYTDRLRNALDERAAREGLTRADAVRLALAEWAGDPELAQMPAESLAAATLGARRRDR